MNLAIIALTKAGKEISFLLADKLRPKSNPTVDLFFSKSLQSEDRDQKYEVKDQKKVTTFESLKQLTGELFSRYDGLIFVMALGIVVRVLAPYLEDKREDPAVVTLDESGQHVISTLSGHLGGANELAHRIAGILEAEPVITTATDCQGKLAFDLLAQKLDCAITPFANLKLANSALVNNRPVKLFTDLDLDVELPDNVQLQPVEELAKQNNFQQEDCFPVIISNQKMDRLFLQKGEQGEYLQLVPRNIIVGVGSRRGVSEKQVAGAVKLALNKVGISRKSIKKMATIDLKSEEQGIINYARRLGVELEIISRKEIKKASFNYTKSEFVKKTIGVGGVCEPAAMIAAQRGKIILSKMSKNKVTVALVEESLEKQKGNCM
ncbi:MAG: cobalt-precorrin 5A hydrolase [Bacillota bacterium]